MEIRRRPIACLTDERLAQAYHDMASSLRFAIEPAPSQTLAKPIMQTCGVRKRYPQSVTLVVY